MKIKKGKYQDQYAIGITYLFANNIKYLIFDFVFFYIEVIFKDYNNK